MTNDYSHAYLMFPHTYAAKMSEGAWEPYDHLRVISLKIVELINNGGGTLLVYASEKPAAVRSGGTALEAVYDRWTGRAIVELPAGAYDVSGGPVLEDLGTADGLTRYRVGSGTWTFEKR